MPGYAWGRSGELLRARVRAERVIPFVGGRLVSVALGEGPNVGANLMRRFRADQRPAKSVAEAPRTAGALCEATERLRAERAKTEARAKPRRTS